MKRVRLPCKRLERPLVVHRISRGAAVKKTCRSIRGMPRPNFGQQLHGRVGLPRIVRACDNFNSAGSQFGRSVRERPNVTAASALFPSTRWAIPR
jgi:hypothetical protein